MPLTIACLQIATVPDNIDANLDALDKAMNAAVEQGAELLITPEMFISGYNINRPLQDYPQDLWLGQVSKLCHRHAIAAIIGGAQITDETTFNAAFFIDEKGRQLSVYHKTHLFGDEERRTFSPGDDLVDIVEFHGVRIAMLICYDVEFPETIRAAAMKGADLMAVPTAQMVPFELVADTVIPARAWENQMYVAYVNHDGVENGLEYVGRSSICSPDGSAIVRCLHGNHLLMAEIDPALVRQARARNPYLDDRRTDLYQ